MKTPTTQPAPPLPEDTADRILVCARDLLLAGGLDGLTMRRVAAAAGLSATAIYRHYEDREALVFAVAEEGFRRFASHLYRGLDAPDPLARMHATGEGYLAFALEHTAYYRVIFMSEAGCFERLADEAARRFSPTFLFLVDRVRECQEHGLIRAGDPAGHAITVWAHCHGLASLWIGGNLRSLGDEAAFGAFYRASVQTVLLGLRP